MSLPLLKHVKDESSSLVRVSPKRRDAEARVPVVWHDAGPSVRSARALMPSRALRPGEQYGFHVDMESCIGCKCCVVACNEQNGNPAAINWRRVVEIEGGWYPQTQRSYLSMGCNHCLEPTCLEGCPVDAYSKDGLTGIVRHSADVCIGCQYCTWNCSYGVPQYNPERGVVGKCDMCYGRLSLDQSPACVNACPEGAIAIEIVAVAAWRAACDADRQPTGVPVADGSLSTTRVTVPDAVPPNAKPLGLTHVTPAEPHWPLVVMTVLTQLSVGAFATIWLLHVLGATMLGSAALTSLGVGALALGASTLHLGRPIHAYRALKMWRRSWLSREVLLFAGFSAVAAAYAGVLWFGLPGASVLGPLTVLLGVSGVFASGCIYRVPSRPAWNTWHTLAQFFLTAGALGPLFAAALGTGNPRWLAVAAASLAGLKLVLVTVRFLGLIASDRIELRGTARLLCTTLKPHFILRGVLLTLGGIVLPLLVVGADLGQGAHEVMLPAAALVLSVTGEILERYLFFVSTVPTHLAAPYLSLHAEAA